MLVCNHVSLATSIATIDSVFPLLSDSPEHPDLLRYFRIVSVGECCILLLVVVMLVVLSMSMSMLMLMMLLLVQQDPKIRPDVCVCACQHIWTELTENFDSIIVGGPRFKKKQ